MSDDTNIDPHHGESAHRIAVESNCHRSSSLDRASCSALTTDEDRRRMDAVSILMQGKIGSEDDIERLRVFLIRASGDPLTAACGAAVSFMRFAQDLKRQLKQNTRTQRTANPDA